MFTLLMSFLTGVLGPLLPNILNLIREWQDRKHELALLEVRLKFAQYEHMWRMEEINARADIEEARTLHLPQQSFGVQLLDAANKWAETTWGKWMITPSFLLFTMLDFINGLVRPIIAYTAFGFYMVYKWSIFQIAKQSSTTTVEAINRTWTENDWMVLLMVLGFFFGQRAAKAVLGGSTQTSRPNG